MKRITAALTALTVVIGLGTSCQKEMENRQETSGNGTGLKVTATIADSGTKVSYQEDNTDHSLQPDWEVGDIIIGFDGNDDSETYGYEVTEVNDGVATLAIITEGDYVGSSTTDPADGTEMYMFYALGKKPSDISDKSLTVSIASQAKDTVPTLMMAQAIVANGSLSLSFTNKTAIIGVKAPVMAAKNKQYTSLALSGSVGLDTEVKFDLNGSNLQASFQIPGTLTKELDFTSDSETGKGPDVIYIVACPATQQDLSFKFNDTEEYFNVNDVAIVESNYYRLEAPSTQNQKFTLTAGPTTNGSITFKHGSETITSGDLVAWGTEVTVTATPNTGYELESIKWQEDGGSETDITSTMKFTMPAKAVTVTVTFKKKLSVFTVGSDTEVSFASGNLYAKKDGSGAWTWGFYDRQYKFHSESMKIISVSGGSRTATAGDTEIDLFCWGYNSTNSTNPVNSEGISGNNKYDCKYNFSDGEDWGNITGLPSAPYSEGWRTLSETEWNYLLDSRVGISPVNGTVNARYLRCKVKDVTVQEGSKKDVYGLMIFPDSFTWPTTVTAPNGNYINNMSLPWNNVPGYTEDDFAALEEAGIVFLPAAGLRYNTTSVISIGNNGMYWSSSANGSDKAYNLLFNGNNVKATDSNVRSSGRSVRLVSVFK